MITRPSDKASYLMKLYCFGVMYHNTVQREREWLNFVLYWLNIVKWYTPAPSRVGKLDVSCVETPCYRDNCWILHYKYWRMDGSPLTELRTDRHTLVVHLPAVTGSALAWKCVMIVCLVSSLQLFTTSNLLSFWQNFCNDSYNFSPVLALSSSRHVLVKVKLVHKCSRD